MNVRHARDLVLHVVVDAGGVALGRKHAHDLLAEEASLIDGRPAGRDLPDAVVVEVGEAALVLQVVDHFGRDRLLGHLDHRHFDVVLVLGGLLVVRYLDLLEREAALVQLLVDSPQVVAQLGLEAPLGHEARLEIVDESDRFGRGSLLLLGWLGLLFLLLLQLCLQLLWLWLLFVLLLLLLLLLLWYYENDLLVGLVGLKAVAQLFQLVVFILKANFNNCKTNTILEIERILSNEKINSVVAFAYYDWWSEWKRFLVGVGLQMPPLA